MEGNGILKNSVFPETMSQLLRIFRLYWSELNSNKKQSLCKLFTGNDVTMRMKGFLTIIHVIIIAIVDLFGPKGHFSHEQLWPTKLSCILSCRRKPEHTKDHQGHAERTCKLITEKTRGLIS